jgi:hypothetical protein
MSFRLMMNLMHLEFYLMYSIVDVSVAFSQVAIVFRFSGAAFCRAIVDFMDSALIFPSACVCLPSNFSSYVSHSQVFCGEVSAILLGIKSALNRPTRRTRFASRNNSINCDASAPIYYLALFIDELLCASWTKIYFYNVVLPIRNSGWLSCRGVMSFF